MGSEAAGSVTGPAQKLPFCGTSGFPPLSYTAMSNRQKNGLSAKVRYLLLLFALVLAIFVIPALIPKAHAFSVFSSIHHGVALLAQENREIVLALRPAKPGQTQTPINPPLHAGLRYPRNGP